MAQKRMFDKRITDSDKFTDLPNSTKALYFMAGMNADDRGFFQPRRLQKMCGFTDDDFKVLIAKRYFISFESGVMVITDWNKNNYLDKNRITETEYIEELNLLRLINEKYELNTACLTDVKPMFNQYSIEENSIEENKLVYKRFKKPTLEEINEYCKERNNNIDAQRFIDFYESKDWMIGKNKMKDWKAAIRTWEKNSKTDTPGWFTKENKTEELSEEEKNEMDEILNEMF
jgi:hypothetical protein